MDRPSSRASLGLVVALVAAATSAHLAVGCSDDGAMGAAVDGGPSDAAANDGEATDASPSVADSGDAAPPPYAWSLPPGFPVPVVPSDNPMTKEKVELGRRLFYDKRLSKNQTQSCASCHHQELAFTDGRAQGLGSTGALHPRSPMTLANVVYTTSLSWANPLLISLERQAQIPIFGEDPVELGTTSTPDLEARVAAEPLYVALFAKAFPGVSQPITLANLLKALASFERTLISGRSPFDRWAQSGDQAAISQSAKRGYALFHSEKFECFHCHLGPIFTDHVTWMGKAFTDRPFHNTGLYNTDGAGAYPFPNTGVEAVTKLPSDMGRFKAPSLRNVAVTGPYMHDGSIATLEEVLDHYVAGGRTIASGPNAGNGSTNPLKDPIIVVLTVTADERSDVIDFLKSLTDEVFLTDKAFSDPWVTP
jgi:cytochrome c peroxidase